MKDIITYENADIGGKEWEALTGVNFNLLPSEFCYILGASGVGKSTFLKSMYAETLVKSGFAMVQGYNLRQIQPKDVPFLRRQIGMIFQELYLFMEKSVYANLVIVLRATGWQDQEKIDKRIKETLEAVQLVGKNQFRVHELSVGEQQRLAMARALLNRPSLIIADEATNNLDRKTAETIMDLLRHLSNKMEVGVVFSTHDHELLKQYPGRTFDVSPFSTKLKTA